MSLPANGANWPPASYSKALGHMAEWSAWYSGDPDQLQSYYQAASRATARTRPAQYAGGVVGKAARWWWGQPTPEGEQRAKLHVPLAADICGTSADLLYSEPVKLTAQDSNASLQAALDDMRERGLDAELHQAAELTAALGGGYLRVCWDADMADLPWTDTVHADMALPEFRWGKLYAVTFWQLLPDLGDQLTYRLLERHEPGRIVHALYAGKSDNIGLQVPLQDHPDAEHLADMVDADGQVLTGTELLTATYKPNMLPNRMDRGSHQGRSDLQGVTPLLDALDEAYSSWWRDIRHAKSRIYMPAQYLQTDGPGTPGITDTDREVHVPLQGALAKSGDGLQIDAQQFAIRVAEHSQTCKEWRDAAIESAGYSTQSLSSGTGGAITAAEVHAHERRSYMTRGKKVRYETAALRDHLQALVEVANANLGAGIREGGISVEFPDGVQENQLHLAQTAQALNVAEAASAETRVRLVHPDWSKEEVDAEVSRILSETGGGPVPFPEDAGL